MEGGLRLWGLSGVFFSFFLLGVPWKDAKSRE